ncbi:metalloprotease family protein [Clostridium sp. AL.422]|uniref:DUF3267 domain-containing protein n=1 Tax=Clostridium TaxID=1485 RepID=UPI00293E0005|nr:MULTISPECIES: metalloprotease family protein [unclassified Clostridium]MDV4149315.1 metalloprotease family protein [Clostridium sp. AL.422]
MGKVKSRENPILDNYIRIREELKNEGYREENSYISILKANILAFLTAGPFAVLFIFVYGFIWKGFYIEITSPYSFLWGWIVLLISIPVHEFLHGFTWQFFCKERWKSIKFGVFWSKLTPYCHCKEAISVKEYLLALLMPFLILGIVTGILSIIIESPFLLFFSVFSILSAGGDTTIALKLFKYRKNKNTLILDHPTECGFVAFEK